MKKIIIIGVITVFIILGFILIKKDKFYLEDKYYNNGDLVELTIEELKNLEDNKESFVVYVHIPNMCTMTFPCTEIVKDFIKKYDITIYDFDFALVNESSMKNKIKYSPTLVIYEEGKIKAYLDPNSDDDIEYYKSVKGIKKYLEKYINLK